MEMKCECDLCEYVLVQHWYIRVCTGTNNTFLNIRDLWAIPGPGMGATQTTGCASERCCGPSLQAGQGDSDGPPCCRRHPVWSGMYLSAITLWQWDISKLGSTNNV